MNSFSKNFVFLRKRFGVTQDWLALQLKKSQSTIGGWGTGASEPNIDLLIKISDIFGIPVDFLIKGDLEKSNLITDEHVDKFNKIGNLIGNPIGNLNPRKIDISSYGKNENETAEVKEWALLALMRSIDEKVDQVRIWQENQDKINVKR